VTVPFGVVAIIWGISVLPSVSRYLVIEDIAVHIAAGAPFKTKDLEKLKPILSAAEQEGMCNPAALRAAAIMDLHLFELAVADSDEEAIDSAIKSLPVAIRRSLSCSPTDSFLWLVLYWVEVNRNGYQPRDLEFLRMSYLLGPNEGWIALKRNRLALAIFDQLLPEMAKAALAEFANLLNSGFEQEVEGILTGPGWKVRDRLLPALKDVKEEYREEFARRLYHNGYDAVIPGVKLPDPRPWD
jgi:hypothetical protein